MMNSAVAVDTQKEHHNNIYIYIYMVLYTVLASKNRSVLNKQGGKHLNENFPIDMWWNMTSLSNIT